MIPPLRSPRKSLKKKRMKKKPTYKLPVSICAIVLATGATVLAVLMETRKMAPPRKYEVDMSGEVIGIDNGPGAQPLETADLPERCLMVFGSEGEGISAELSAGCSRLLRIGQYGSTRSINVAAAAAVAMHTWILQHAGPAPD